MPEGVAVTAGAVSQHLPGRTGAALQVVEAAHAGEHLARWPDRAPHRDGSILAWDLPLR